MEEQQHLFDLQIDPSSQASLAQTAKWGKFISIVGFISIGLAIIFAFTIGTIMSTFASSVYPSNGLGVMPGAFFTVVGLATAAIYFIPTLLLFQFSTRMKKALDSNDQELLAQAFASQKSLYKFYGILMIIFLAFLALEIVGVLIVLMLKR